MTSPPTRLRSKIAWWAEPTRATTGSRLFLAVFPAVDILPDPAIRTELSAISDWPTIPQVFVKGELIGGADITEELFASGELGRKLDEALGTDREQVVKTVVMAATAA